MLIFSQRLWITSLLLQSTKDDSSAHEHLNPCSLLDSETNEKNFPFKEEFETFKVIAISEIKKSNA